MPSPVVMSGDFTDEIACKHLQLSKDVKCACDDGSLVHPWECCTTAASGCNVFCCNCGGPCKKKSPNGTEAEDNRIGKRSVRNFLDNSEIAVVRLFIVLDYYVQSRLCDTASCVPLDTKAN